MKAKLFVLTALILLTACGDKTKTTETQIKAETSTQTPTETSTTTEKPEPSTEPEKKKEPVAEEKKTPIRKDVELNETIMWNVGQCIYLNRVNKYFYELYTGKPFENIKEELLKKDSLPAWEAVITSIYGNTKYDETPDYDIEGSVRDVYENIKIEPPYHDYRYKFIDVLSQHDKFENRFFMFPNTFGINHAGTHMFVDKYEAPRLQYYMARFVASELPEMEDINEHPLMKAYTTSNYDQFAIEFKKYAEEHPTRRRYMLYWKGDHYVAFCNQVEDPSKPLPVKLFRSGVVIENDDEIPLFKQNPNSEKSDRSLFETFSYLKFLELGKLGDPVDEKKFRRLYGRCTEWDLYTNFKYFDGPENYDENDD